jgi:hypothetical protein
MNYLFLFFLLYALFWRIFPPKKPNNWYGYQLGSAKKSKEHWRVANRSAANGLIIIYSLSMVLFFIEDKLQLDFGYWVLPHVVIGGFLIYWMTEKRLKKIDQSMSTSN